MLRDWLCPLRPRPSAPRLPPQELNFSLVWNYGLTFPTSIEYEIPKMHPSFRHTG